MGLDWIFVCFDSGSILLGVKNCRTKFTVNSRFGSGLLNACVILDFLYDFKKKILRWESVMKKKKEPWWIIVGVLAIAFIIYTWIDKDILAVYGIMPKEQMIPMVATIIAVTLVKVAAITLGILLIKWIIKRFINRK